MHDVPLYSVFWIYKTMHKGRIIISSNDTISARVRAHCGGHGCQGLIIDLEETELINNRAEYSHLSSQRNSLPRNTQLSNLWIRFIKLWCLSVRCIAASGNCRLMLKMSDLTGEVWGLQGERTLSLELELLCHVALFPPNATATVIASPVPIGCNWAHGLITGFVSLELLVFAAEANTCSVVHIILAGREYEKESVECIVQSIMIISHRTWHVFSGHCFSKLNYAVFTSWFCYPMTDNMQENQLSAAFPLITACFDNIDMLVSTCSLLDSISAVPACWQKIDLKSGESHQYGVWQCPEWATNCLQTNPFTFISSFSKINNHRYQFNFSFVNIHSLLIPEQGQRQRERGREGELQLRFEASN